MAKDIEDSRFHELLMFWALEARISSFYQTELLELKQEKSGNIPGKMGKYYSKKFETQELRNFGNLSLPVFEFLNFRNLIFDNKK